MGEYSGVDILLYLVALYGGVLLIAATSTKK